MTSLSAPLRMQLRLACAAALTALLGGCLTACSVSPESTALRDRCEHGQQPGVAGEVRVSGALGEMPGATFQAPLSAGEPHLARSGGGSGDPITPHGVFEGTFTVLDGRDGQVLLSHAPFAVNENGAQAPITQQALADDLPGLAEAVRCARAGERLVAAMPGEALASSRDNVLTRRMPETVIAIADILRVYPSGASGTALPPAEGFPAVVTAPSGHPGVTVPRKEPPISMRANETIRGHGEPVRLGQRLTLHIAIHAWSTGELLGSTRAPGSRVEQLIATSDGWHDGLYGATPALIGHGVGTQLVTIVPSEQASGLSGPVQGSRIRGETLVLVIDVLAADPLSP